MFTCCGERLSVGFGVTSRSITTSMLFSLDIVRWSNFRSDSIFDEIAVGKDIAVVCSDDCTGISQGTGGRTIQASAFNFPGAIGNGIAMTVGYLNACGINLPHTHPRATEINFSVDGDFDVGFLQENGVSFVSNKVKRGTAAIFPQGAIHFEQNLNCVPATFVAAFNSEDPGVLTIANQFFGGLPATVVGASLGGLNISTIQDIRMTVAKNPSVGIAECRKRCGL
ncbi:unnamed protein product [Rotaria sordida]|uniref:Cupin type-1 domain-containing protein n=1 Tax=Rotaria sordida TaxID=392033 RepID=A0A819LR98_9BILA|nr:unnamed protein product [Rotaria sordida]